MSGKGTLPKGWRPPTLPKGWKGKDAHSGSSQSEKITKTWVLVVVILASIPALLAVPLVSDYYNEKDRLLNYIVIPLAIGSGLWVIAVRDSHVHNEPLRTIPLYSFLVALMSLGIAALISSEILGKIKGIDNPGFDPYYTAMFVELFLTSWFYVLLLVVFHPWKKGSMKYTLPKGYKSPDRASSDSDLESEGGLSTRREAPGYDDDQHDRGWGDIGDD